MEEKFNYYEQFEIDEEIKIDFKKNFKAFISRKKLFYTVFLITFVFFVSMFYFGTKKYAVSADLYINSKQNTNIADINPYVMDEGVVTGFTGIDKVMNNELELIQSSLVVGKVIDENNIRYGKLFGIFPTAKTGKLLTVEAFLKKGIKIKIKKSSNVISIEYKSKDKELAYGVVNSVIENYVALHKEINSAKSKSDKKIIEEGYNKAKAELDVKMDDVNGVPDNAFGNNGGLAAMSAFSESARKAVYNLSGEVIKKERAQIELNAEAEKIKQLAARLQWADLVAEMSNNSKVFVIKEPQMPENYEQVSPKFFTQILLGIVFGFLFGLTAVLFAELQDKKLTYSVLGENIIYDLKKELLKLKSIIFVNNSKFGKTLLVTLSDISPEDLNLLRSIKNIKIIKSDISDDFINVLREYKNVILLEKIGDSDIEEYRTVKQIIESMRNEILTEVLI